MKSADSQLVVIPPFPDGEVVNGLMARLYPSDGTSTLEVAYQRLLSRLPGLDSMPSGLGDFHKVIGHLYGDLQFLLARHTALEFFCCGLPFERISAQRDRVINVCHGPVRLTWLPVLLNVSERAYLQCSECEKEQQRKFGFTFVHRRTGAPFVSACPIHQCVLRPAATQGLLFDSFCRSAPTSYQRLQAVEFAQRVEECMEGRAASSRYHKDKVAQHLSEGGWTSDKGRVYLQELLESFPLFFSGAFTDARLNLLVQSSKYVGAAVRNLMRKDRGIHPVWCVLFSWFADDCHRSSRTVVRTPGQRRVAPSADDIRAHLAGQATLTAAAKEMGLGTSQLSQLCRRYNINVSRRPKWIDESIYTDIVAALEQGLSPRDITKRFRVSQPTVYRILAGRPQIEMTKRRTTAQRTAAEKENWLAVLKLNPEASLTALRSLRPTTYGYLRRHEPRWLREHGRANRLVQKRRRGESPTLLMNLLVDALSKVPTQRKESGWMPVRKSMYRMRSATGVSEYALATSVSKSFNAVQEESRHGFVRRRVEWARSRLVSRNPKNWELARAASLRVETIQKYMMTVHKADA